MPVYSEVYLENLSVTPKKNYFCKNSAETEFTITNLSMVTAQNNKKMMCSWIKLLRLAKMILKMYRKVPDNKYISQVSF